MEREPIFRAENTTYTSGEYQVLAADNPLGVESEMNAAHALVWAHLENEMKNLGAGAWVGDFGAGEGRYARAVLERLNDQVRIVGVDLSTQLLTTGRQLEIARRHAGGEGGYYPLRMDIGHLGLADERLDLGLSVFALHHLEPTELPGAFQEMFRVAKPGASLLVAVNTVKEDNLENTGLTEQVLNQVVELDLLDHRPGQRVLATVHNHLYLVEEYLAAATEAGFEVIEVLDAPYPNTIARSHDPEWRERGLEVYETIMTFRRPQEAFEQG